MQNAKIVKIHERKEHLKSPNFEYLNNHPIYQKNRALKWRAPSLADYNKVDFIGI